MTTIHDQAMNYVYQQVLHRLLGFFSRGERTALQLFIQRLVVEAGGMEHIGGHKVLVTHSGTRESSYTLAFLRAAQLSIAGRAPATFNLRVATLRHPGQEQATLNNIHRSFSALFVYDDPRVEVLMLDGAEVLAFNHQAPLSPQGRELYRRNVLMSGHLAASDRHLEMGDSHRLASGNFLGKVAYWNEAVDTLVSSHSPREQRQYLQAFVVAARQLGQRGESRAVLDFGDLFRALNDFGQDYYRQLCPQLSETCDHAPGHFEVRRPVSYLGLHDLVSESEGARESLLCEFLGMHWDTPCENLYASPLLMTHTYGLQARYVNGLSYEEGVRQYLQLTTVLMRKKNLCENLIQLTLSDYSTPERIEDRRLQADLLLSQSLGLSEVQLVCLLFAPFVNGAAGLERFMRACHPQMLVGLAEVHKALRGEPAMDQVVQWLGDVSGLPLPLLGKLYTLPAHDSNLPPLPETGVARHLGERSDVALEEPIGR